MNSYQMNEKLKHKAKQLANLRSAVQCRERKLMNQTTKITVQKRLLINVVNAQGRGVDKVIKNCIDNGRSEEYMLEKFTFFVSGYKQSRKYSKKEVAIAILVMCLGSYRLFETMHRAGLVMSSSATRQRMNELLAKNEGIIHDARGLEEKALSVFCKSQHLQFSKSHVPFGGYKF